MPVMVKLVMVAPRNGSPAGRKGRNLGWGSIWSFCTVTVPRRPPLM